MNKTDANRIVRVLTDISNHLSAIAYFMDKDKDEQRAYNPFCKVSGYYLTDCNCTVCDRSD